jgi:hypothetical protein
MTVIFEKFINLNFKHSFKMKKIVKNWKKSLLILAIAMPLTAMADGLNGNDENERRFWGKQDVPIGLPVQYPDGHCEQTIEVHQYIFWIDVATVAVGAITVPCP